MARYLPAELPYVVPSASGPETLDDVLAASRYGDTRAQRASTGGIAPHPVRQRLVVARHDRGPAGVSDASAYADAPIIGVDSVTVGDSAISSDAYEMDGDRLIISAWGDRSDWSADVELVGVVGYGRLQMFGTVRQVATVSETEMASIAQAAGNEGDYEGVAGRAFLIDSELMYEEEEGGQVRLVRGANGTAASAHAIGAAIHRVRVPADVESAVRTIARRTREMERVAADQRGATGDFGLPVNSALFANLTRTFTALKPQRYTDWTTE